MKIRYIYNKKDTRNKNFTKLIQTKFPKFINEKNPDLILVAGGDGAMLHAITDTIDLCVPYFGKALGTMNFLMNDFDNDEIIIKKLINQELKIHTIKTYAISASLDGKKIGEAINEVVLGNNISDYFNFNITSEHEDFLNFELKGGGICISTEIGSTAYNFNNGGRILPIGSNLLSLTGIVCDKYLNDIIPFQELRIKSDGSKIYLSNIETKTLNSGSELILKKGSMVKLAFLNKKEFLKKRIEFAHRYRK